ncbi:hypothetical protein CC78DRAFT_535426 [Lojkania enalia]|uniref:LPXTG-motif cell wall anchor domain protein n=1 Tax=Lojkania enalia TaxID=147567 RepID=A0A9P4K7W1_9PLEO|nr:hypothetical protein CC78DRAFT_535426 [Didymosphaeria enalia]
MPTHLRRASTGKHQHLNLNNNSSSGSSSIIINNNNSTSQTSTSPATHPRSHQRTHTAPTTPTLLRLPSSSSTGASTSPRSRRVTNPSDLTPSQVSTSTATSPSYFSPQPNASGKEPRSPANRRPPASFSGHGVDTSNGPPITLITRGTVDIARRSQRPNDFAFAQQQLLQLGLVSPGGTPQRACRNSRGSEDAVNTTQAQTQMPSISRQNSTSTQRQQLHMASSVDDSSEYDSGLRSQSEDARAAAYDHREMVSAISATGGEQGEDLFLNIAEDSSKDSAGDISSRADKLRESRRKPPADPNKSRIARASIRQSLPSNAFSSTSTTPNASKIPSTIETKSTPQHRRGSNLPTTSSSTRAQRDQSPLSPANALEIPRSRLLDLSPKPPFSTSRSKEQEPPSHQFPSHYSRRRPSYPDTPPSRNQTYRPSNLHYSSSRDNQEASHVDITQETSSRADGTESLDSTGPPASVWDELDDLKSRIRRIELGGKTPSTSAAVVSNASGDRPRTANTSVTTASSSPQHQRKSQDPAMEAFIDPQTPHKVHPLLRDALRQAKLNLSPAVYRVLEATASEALELAELTGSAGPQRTLVSASSIINGATVPDRHVRRKADNICRSLTELCIALCDTKSSLQSPAIRNAAGSASRRPSVQINGESPSIQASIEPESNTLPRSSPSRALSRIEARRTSLLVNGSPRESSQEPLTPSQLHIPTRLSRAGTSLHRTRRTGDEEDEDLTLRAPSRAMTDFREIRPTNKANRISREYTSREPMPDLQPSPALQHTSSLRRPTVSGIENTSLLFRDANRRYNLDRQNSPVYEKQMSADTSSRVSQLPTQYSSNRTSIGALGLSRTGSLSRRLRGNGAVE